MISVSDIMDETGEKRIAGRGKMVDETGERRIAGCGKMVDETGECITLTQMRI